MKSSNETITISDAKNVRVGESLRVMLCADGLFRLHDDARPFGQQTSKKTFKTAAEGVAFAERLLAKPAVTPILNATTATKGAAA